MNVANALAGAWAGWRGQPVATGAVRRIPWVLALLALAYTGWTYDFHTVLPVLGRIPVAAFVLTGSALIVLTFVIAALRWIGVAGLPLRLGVFLQAYVYTTVAITVGQYTPMQIGEALKLRFARRSGLSLRGSALSMAVERVVDLIVVGDLAAIGLVHRQTASVGWLAAVAIVPVAVLFGLIVNLKRLRSPMAGWRGASWLDAATAAFTAPRVGALLVLTGLKWFVVALLWQRTLAFVGCDLGMADAMLTVSTVSILSVVSMVPGGLGIQDLSLKAMLVTLGIHPDSAEAGSVAVRLLTPLMILIGAVHLPGLWATAKASIDEHGR